MTSLEVLLVTLAFIGVVTGTLAGAFAGWRRWPALQSFAAAVLVFVCIAAVIPNLSSALDASGTIGAILVAPLIALLPTGAGFVVGRRFVLQLLGRSEETPPDEPR